MIFLGAGASSAFGIPTSNELTGEIRDLLVEYDDLLKNIDNHFSSTRQRKPNYEEILTILTAYTNPAEVQWTHYSRDFVNLHPNLKRDYNDLIDKMYTKVCKHCTAPFEEGSDKYLKPNDLEVKFQMTYDALIGTMLSYNRSDLVFSTNYDPSFEIWCQKRNLRCIDGTAITQNPEVKKVDSTQDFLNILNPIPTLSAQGRINDEVGLVRLHGSIWTYEVRPGYFIKFNVSAAQRSFLDLYNILTTKHPNLIFPGQENRVAGGQWDSLYQFFKQQLRGRCLFIGYSFRHDIIDEPILDKLRSNEISLLGVLGPDPDEMVKNLTRGQSIPNKKIVKMPCNFGEIDALEELARKWFPQSIGIDLASSYRLQSQTSTWRKNREGYIK